MQNWIKFAGAAIVACAMTAPALAATERDCEEAIAAAQKAIGDNPVDAMTTDNIANEWSETLIRAGGYGQQGNPDKCIEVVNEVRDQAGVPLK